MAQHAPMISQVAMHARVRLAIRALTANTVQFYDLGNVIFLYKLILKSIKALPCILIAPCQNGGTCTNDMVGGYTCACTASFTGTNCQICNFLSTVFQKETLFSTRILIEYTECLSLR